MSPTRKVDDPRGFHDAEDFTVVQPRRAGSRADTHSQSRSRHGDVTVSATRKPWEPSPSVLAEETVVLPTPDSGLFQAKALPVVYGVRTGDVESSAGLTGYLTPRRVPPAPGIFTDSGADPNYTTDLPDRSGLASIERRTLRGRTATVLVFAIVIVASVSGIIAIARAVMG